MDRSLANNHLMWLYLNGILKQEPSQGGATCYQYRARSPEVEKVISELESILLNRRKQLFEYLHRG